MPHIYVYLFIWTNLRNYKFIRRAAWKQNQKKVKENHFMTSDIKRTSYRNKTEQKAMQTNFDFNEKKNDTIKILYLYYQKI